MKALCLVCLPALCWVFATLQAYAQPAQVQVNADCVIAFNITTSGATAPATGGFDNRRVGCNSWQISYANNTFSAISLRVESAPDSAGTPGSFGSIGGTLTFGINPNTNTTGASTLIQAYGTSFAPWVRVALTSATGSGSVVGILLGYRAAGVAGTSGAGSVAANVNVTQYGSNNVASAGLNGLLAVGGAAADGVASAGNPVLIGGHDSAGTPLAHIIQTDTFGGILPSGVTAPLADGTSNTETVPAMAQAGASVASTIRDFPFNFNGTTWDRQFACTSQADVALSGTGYTQIIALSGSTVIRLCKVFVTSVSGGNPVINTFTLAYGTGANCAGGTTELLTAGGVAGMDSDFQGSLRTAAANAFCVKEATANSDKVTVTYAQY